MEKELQPLHDLHKPQIDASLLIDKPAQASSTSPSGASIKTSAAQSAPQNEHSDGQKETPHAVEAIQESLESSTESDDQNAPAKHLAANAVHNVKSADRHEKSDKSPKKQRVYDMNFVPNELPRDAFTTMILWQIFLGIVGGLVAIIVAIVAVYRWKKMKLPHIFPEQYTQLRNSMIISNVICASIFLSSFVLFEAFRISYYRYYILTLLLSVLSQLTVSILMIGQYNERHKPRANFGNHL